MCEQAILQVDIEEDSFLNGDTFYLWHAVYFDWQIYGFTGLEKSSFVLQTAEAVSVLQSLSLNSPSKTFKSNSESSPGKKFRLTPYLKSIFLEDLKLANIKLKVRGRVQAQMQ